MMLFKFHLILVLALIEIADLDARRPRKGCKDEYIMCDCGEQGDKVQIPVHKCFEKNPITGKGSCQICNRHAILGNFCAKFKACQTCFKDLNRCASCPEGKAGPFCSLDKEDREDIVYPDAEQGFSDDQDNNNAISTYPIKVTIHSGEPLSNNRHLRSDSCQYPSSVETADIHCTIYVEQVVCSQACIWGYTLPESRTRDISCSFKDNRWSPKEFEECQPFVNCNIKFKSAGDMVCVYNKVDTAPTCELSCAAFNGQPEVPMTTHNCMPTGEWNPPLPHCIMPDKNIIVVPFPRPQL